MKSVFLILALGLLLLPLRAEDWTTTTGQTYTNVKVLSHDDAYVTIMHQDGGGKIPLSSLTPDLQKRFGYDPAKATQLIAANAKTAQQNREAVEQRNAALQAAREKAAADALTAALFAPPPDADVPPAGSPSNPPPPQEQPGLIVGYETTYPVFNDSNYGDWGYGGYGYGYPAYGYNGYGYGRPRIYSYGGYGGGWNRHYGTRSSTPGAYHGGTGYPPHH